MKRLGHLLARTILIAPVLACRAIDTETLDQSEWVVATVAADSLAIAAVETADIVTFPSPPPESTGFAEYTPKMIATLPAPVCLVAVGDALNKRVHLFTDRGEYRRTIRLDQRSPAPVENLSHLVTSRDGHLAVFDAQTRTAIVWNVLKEGDSTVVKLRFGMGEVLSDGIALLGGGLIAEALAALEGKLTTIPPALVLYSADGTVQSMFGAHRLWADGGFTGVLSRGTVAGNDGHMWTVSMADGRLQEYDTNGIRVVQMDLPAIGPIVIPSRRIASKQLASQADLGFPVGLNRPFVSVVAGDGEEPLVLVKWYQDPSNAGSAQNGIASLRGRTAVTIVRMPFPVIGVSVANGRLLAVEILVPEDFGGDPGRVVRSYPLAPFVADTGRPTEVSCV